MSEYDSIPRRRFYRNRDKAWIAGVCAGLADYFGFNIRVTRILAFISLLMAFPITVLVYIGAVLLFPSRREEPPQPEYDVEFRQALRASPAQTLSDVRRRFQGLEARLAKLERYVTSSRFDLDQEFRRL
ncbi:MAG: envelope stress response membrane protein PspC [Gammaproteobacteria bacterium]|nr:envelope stress response membrane protein PspC [Gammaproteobacteria bacterium]